jgi:hypothetical protein
MGNKRYSVAGWNQDYIPCPRFSMAEVIKMLKILLKTRGSKTLPNEPPSLQARITII